MTEVSERGGAGRAEGAEEESDASETAATVVERKSARPRRSQPGQLSPAEPGSTDSQASSGGASASASADPLSASFDHDEDDEVRAIMQTEEAARGRAFSTLTLWMGGFMLLCLAFLPGNPAAKLACALSDAAIVLTSAWTRRQLSNSKRNVQRTLRVYGWVMVTGVLAVEVYLGFFSAVVVVISLGIHYMGMSQDRVSRVVLPGFVVGSWALGAVGTATGLLPDVGVLSLDSDQPLSVHLFLVLAIGMTLGIAWWTSGRAQASLEEAVRSARDAMAKVLNREALLAEAQNQLDRAMRLSIGQPGRYTGRVAGDQLLEVLVGFGAMGEVYAATRKSCGARSAVKLLRPEALGDERMVERFLREAHICSQLRHPNVVEILEVGQLDSGAPFMAMELLEGNDLAALLRRVDHLPWPEVLELARAVAGALDHAHAAGIIHRDLKPHNVFKARVADGSMQWKVLDFGISKVMTQSGTLTQDGVVGTPGYMSPEQASGAEIDARSDVFAMASLLYRATTGRPAFPGKDTPTIMFDVVFKMPERPTSAHAQVPKLLDEVLLIALSKAPKDRFASAGALVKALEHVERGNLPADVHKRARRALARHPWGLTIK